MIGVLLEKKNLMMYYNMPVWHVHLRTQNNPGIYLGRYLAATEDKLLVDLVRSVQWVTSKPIEQICVEIERIDFIGTNEENPNAYCLIGISSFLDER